MSEKNVSELPTFGPTAVFFEVEGDPVSFDDGKALRWINGKPEPMSAASAARGNRITEARFRQMAARRPAHALVTMPLEDFANRAAAEIAENLRRQTSTKDDEDGA